MNHKNYRLSAEEVEWLRKWVSTIGVLEDMPEVLTARQRRLLLAYSFGLLQMKGDEFQMGMNLVEHATEAELDYAFTATGERIQLVNERGQEIGLKKEMK